MGKSIIYDNLPALGSSFGFFFYAILVYLLVQFIMFMIAGSEEDIREEAEKELEVNEQRYKGRSMRAENKQELLQQQ